MTKSEWKSNYKSARIIHSGLVKMMMINREGCDGAIQQVWKAIDNLGMTDVMFGAKKRMTHDIRANRWAIKTNSQGTAV